MEWVGVECEKKVWHNIRKLPKGCCRDVSLKKGISMECVCSLNQTNSVKFFDSSESRWNWFETLKKRYITCGQPLALRNEIPHPIDQENFSALGKQQISYKNNFMMSKWLLTSKEILENLKKHSASTRFHLLRWTKVLSTFADSLLTSQRIYLTLSICSEGSRGDSWISSWIAWRRSQFAGNNRPPS